MRCWFHCMYVIVACVLIQVTCRAKKGYSGYRCPVFSYGLLTSVCAPWCSEGFIKVEKGDIITVSRWESKWVFGNKHLSKGRSLSL